MFDAEKLGKLCDKCKFVHPVNIDNLSSALITIISFVVCCSGTCLAAEQHFSTYQKGDGKGNTLLVIGGIHGDEPGGYFAAMILSRNYTFSNGNVWVVPNLNFDSIVRNRRGIYGDMNRKFLTIDPDDDDYQIVKDVQSLITDPDVDMVLNLHDGHGFYREKEVDALFNPRAWGQACIIDQTVIPGIKFGNLKQIAERINEKTNIHLREDVHRFNTKNTLTKDKDEAMQKSLTYFAIRNKKPAFAIETSKNIKDLSLKIFYQLKTIESFMDILGIEYKRDFNFTRSAIMSILNNYGGISFNDIRMFLPLTNLRSRLTYIPVNKSGDIEFSSTNPLVALLEDGRYLKIMNGNIHVTTLHIERYPVDSDLSSISLIVDGIKRSIPLGSVIHVNYSFEVLPLDAYRINVIGFQKKGVESEAGISIGRNDIPKRFSIDRDGKLFRVEFYKGNHFCGMLIVHFF